mgnify:CR=1 FL=1
MSDPTSDSPENDPNAAPPTVELIETQPGSVHVVLSVQMPADASSEPPPGPPPPAKPNEATEVGRAVVGGAAKAVGKVLGEIWDSVKPKEN